VTTDQEPVLARRKRPAARDGGLASTVLNTNRIAVPSRADAVRAIVRKTLVDVEIAFAGGDRAARVSGLVVELGRITVCSFYSNALTVERTAEQARDDLPPTIFVGLRTTGSSRVIQGGREAVLRPGDLVFSESTTPHVLADRSGIRQHFFSIPVAALALPQDMIRATAAVLLAPRHPVADVTAAYFARIAARPDVVTEAGNAALGQPGIDLVRALITTHHDAVTLARDPLRATLGPRILESARAQLADPGLNAVRLAAEHHISVRQLYKVMAEAEISLGEWIRAERLEACRADLARPGARVSIVARRWGFTNSSTFGRLFRQAYGLSPREWVAANRSGGPGRGEDAPTVHAFRPQVHDHDDLPRADPDTA
jgi:AraC-like DNA-binding protein